MKHTKLALAAIPVTADSYDEFHKLDISIDEAEQLARKMEELLPKLKKLRSGGKVDKAMQLFKHSLKQLQMAKDSLEKVNFEHE